MSDENEAYQEVDCPWWDPDWLETHPDHPLASHSCEVRRQLQEVGTPKEV
jgi:hypothetical protein